MSLVTALKRLGGRLGLVSLPDPGAGPRAASTITTRTVALADLLQEMKSRQAERPAGGEAWRPLPAAQVHAAAGIADGPHSAVALAARVRQPDCTGLTREQVQVALLNELAAARVRVEDVVRDAIARDQAMDAHAAQARASLSAARAARRARREAIAAAQRQLADEDAALAAGDERDERAWAQWWQGKLADERELAATLLLLTDAPAITIDERLPSLGSDETA